MFGRKPTKIVTDKDVIAELLSRNVEEVFVRESLEKKLLSGKQLRVKLGFDPTSPNIHLGRAIVLRKLREFQKLGHIAVFVVGDFTARIGDPSDKLEKRPMLETADIQRNLKNYKSQVGKIIDLSKAEFYHNSSWLSKLKFEDIATLSESFSVQQMSNRRNFKDRLDRGDEVSLREFLYPLMQGYDSVAINADVELGGFDQLFNLKAGRIVQRHYKKPEQDVVTTKMLLGTDGRKMSSSWGNVINVTDSPDEMFGKTMSVADTLIGDYFALCTDATNAEIGEIQKLLSSGTNPKDVKVRLAADIVTFYHGETVAARAAENFKKTFGEGAIPENIPRASVAKGVRLDEVLLANKIVESKSEFGRLVREGAITIVETGEKISNIFAQIENAGTFRVGKKRFISISIK